MASISSPRKSNKKENIPPSTSWADPYTSSSLVTSILAMASAYNSNNDNAVHEAQKGFVKDLGKAKVVGQIRAEDKMLAGVMEGLIVKGVKDVGGKQNGGMENVSDEK